MAQALFYLLCEKKTKQIHLVVFICTVSYSKIHQTCHESNSILEIAL